MRARDSAALALAIGLLAACGSPSVSPSPAPAASADESTTRAASAPGGSSRPRTVTIEVFPDPPRAGELLVIAVQGLSPGERASIQVTPGGPATEVRTTVDGVARLSVVLGDAPSTGWTITVMSAGDTLVTRSISPRSVSAAAALASPPPQPPRPPSPTAVTFEFPDAISAVDQRDIRDGIAYVQEYIKAVMGGAPERPVTVNVRTGGIAYDSRGQLLFACCQAERTAIYLDVAHPDWSYTGRYQPTAQVTHLKIVAHEYTHVWSFDPGGGGCMQSAAGGYLSARWILEGTAEYLAHAMLVRDGFLSQQTMDARIASARLNPVSVRVLETDNWPRDASDTYGASMAAMDLLLRDRGGAAFTSYCSAVGTGTEWHVAFAQIFGVSVAEFYARFDRWLAGQ